MGKDRVRTTVLLPLLLDRNLEAFCLKTRRQKSQVMQEALERYLTANRVDPERELFIEWT